MWLSRRLHSVQPFSGIKKKAPIQSAFRKSHDVVAQCVQLSRVSSSPEIWNNALESVIPAVSMLKGEDIATILRSTAKIGVRNETLLASICESLKTLPILRVLRVKDIASILSSFARLNFVPSVETLNSLAKEVMRSVDLYRTRSQDICKLFRYFSILNRDQNLVIRYQTDFDFPHILERLEREITRRIGYFGPVEICIISKYADRISLETLIRNFSRAQHVRPEVRRTFLNILDQRFGPNAWRQYEHLFVPDQDSSGWSREVPDPKEPVDDIFTLLSQKELEGSIKKRLPLFRLDDNMVQAFLNSEKSATSWKKKPNDMKIAEDADPVDTPLSEDQLEFLRMLEEELGAHSGPKKETVKPFTERVDRKLVRSIELSDIGNKPEAPELQKMRKLKRYRSRVLRRFTLLDNR
jgi:hypothetical protein